MDRAAVRLACAFPDVFAHGGFDVVIGNPPYVRSEHLSAIKPWLKQNFSVFDAGADLYCYFYERGLKILKENGRLGFISSCGFFKTAFGNRLREYLKTEAVLECGIDFGDARIFEEVTTYPTVLTLRKEKPSKSYEISFLNYSEDGSGDLGSVFVDKYFSFPSDRLNRSRWHFEVCDLWKLRDRLERAAVKRLGDISSPVSGIKTGLTSAFVISDAIRNQLIARDANSDELIRPWAVRPRPNTGPIRTWCAPNSTRFWPKPARRRGCHGSRRPSCFTGPSFRR